MTKCVMPCASCPWRLDTRAADISNFDIALAEALSDTCPDSRNMGPDVSASFFACHRSKPGEEFVCAGWLAKVGHRHPRVGLAVMQERISAAARRPASDWPELHESYRQVLEKLRLMGTTE